MSLAESSGRLTYTPDEHFNELTTVTVVVRDDHPSDPRSSSIKIEFHVEDVEDAPILPRRQTT